ncbi:MAG: carbohydrate-binding protein, partial [Clostridium sp.]|nr:carbohydrate-binding protein [Clostridium sp.]
FEARVASATSGGKIELRIDSPNGMLIGTCPVVGTGGWQTWSTVTCDVSSVKGMHDLYLVFKGGSGYLFNINWWKFYDVSIEPTPIPTGLLGDANEDGSIDSLDLQLIKRHVLRKLQLTGTALANADVNRDGSVDTLDCSLLKRYILRKIPSFD